MGYKKIDDLVEHLNKNGIEISGNEQKRNLINTGYYHGYKGYRFFKDASNRLPFSSYDEIYSTIQYDEQLKGLFYSKIMFIETAMKNIALLTIMEEINSEKLSDMYIKAIAGYKNASEQYTSEQKKRMQKNKLILQERIQSSLSKAYNAGNKKIVHYYHNKNYDEVPLWATFEIIFMGDFGYLLSCLTLNMRERVSKALGINLSADTKCELVYKYVYALKDLRNAVAHNDIVFDTRFRKIDPTRPMKQCLKFETGLPYINFKTIGDYIALVCYYLKLLMVPKDEIQKFIQEYENIVQRYEKNVGRRIRDVVIHPDQKSRIEVLKKFM